MTRTAASVQRSFLARGYRITEPDAQRIVDDEARLTALGETADERGPSAVSPSAGDGRSGRSTDTPLRRAAIPADDLAAGDHFAYPVRR